MILISHRGNIEKRDIENENKPEYVTQTLSNGFLVEIDVWYDNGDFFLGHDIPQYRINDNFLLNQNFLCHAKNYKALEAFLAIDKINHYFWHQNDDYTLSSKRIPIIYPGKKVINGSIIMSRDNTIYTESDIKKCFGICSDDLLYFKNLK